MAAHANLNSLGRAYIGLVVAWTVLLVGGMSFLHYHRQLPSLQIRRLPLVFGAVISLHIYGVLCMLGYTVGAFVPCTALFWVMSIYLPLGVALLQAANSQFLHIASQQRKFAHLSSLDVTLPPRTKATVDPRASRWTQITQKVLGADKITRMTFLIFFGLFVNFAITIFVYFGSRKFHPGYGFIKATLEGTPQEQAFQCSKGWEWWLSIVWQFFWAWIYAPYLLWKARNIHDTHGWRIQTICCCIAGLPASPLWLAGLYAPGMATMNQYWTPPQWFSASIFFIEVFVIGFPCWQVIKSHNLRQETLDAIASWEKRNQCSGSIETVTANSAKDSYSDTTLKGIGSRKSAVTKVSVDSRKSDMFTMHALENALRTNVDPLLKFAALKDFSGENVSFLSHVANWKKGWASLNPEMGDDRRREQFIKAVRIYSSFVSLEYSEFPINISSTGFRQLQGIFESSAVIMNRSRSLGSDSATPFDEVSPNASTASLRNAYDLEALGQANLKSVSNMAELNVGNGLGDVPIPASFTPAVFDYAEKEIKYLVLTNTWPKFVNAGLAEQVEHKDLGSWAKNIFRGKFEKFERV